jgi:hypothetical protein
LKTAGSFANRKESKNKSFFKTEKESELCHIDLDEAMLTPDHIVKVFI